jgi:hypothetical protein
MHRWFLPLNKKNVEESLRELIGILIRYGLEPRVLKSIRDGMAEEHTGRYVHVFQLSDIHVDDAEVERQRVAQGSDRPVPFPRILGLISEKRREYGNACLPIISGDLFESPSEFLKASVIEFADSVRSMFGRKPFCVLGNHDVRKGGYRGYKPGPIIETDLIRPIGGDLGIKLVGFNSCEESNLGRGHVPKSQFEDRKRLLAKVENNDEIRLGVVHHHPLRLPHPEWEYWPFWRRLIEPFHDPTVHMKGGEKFLRRCKDMGIGLVLHGHKHIPWFEPSTGIDGLSVVACGSTTGKIRTRDGLPYNSLNIITIDRKLKEFTVRLIADRGDGLLVKRAGTSLQDNMVERGRLP